MGHSGQRRDRGTGMARPKSIVKAFSSFWKTADASLFPHGSKAFAAACEPFVNIGLMAYIPDQNILWRMKDRVQSDA